MPGCRCAEFYEVTDIKAIDAMMVDDRNWDSSSGMPRFVRRSGLPFHLHVALEEAAAAAGRPFLTIKEDRWNADGDPIGPRLETRECEMVEVRLLVNSVIAQIESIAQRLAAAH